MAYTKRPVKLDKTHKRVKYAKELENNVALTNDLKVKKRKGKVVRLNATQKAYKKGFVDACRSR